MFGSSQGNETKKIEKELKAIEKDLMNDLINADETIKEDSTSVPSSTVNFNNGIIVNKHITKLFCDVKNGIIARILAKDLDDNIKEVILAEFKNNEREIEIYKQILEHVGNKYCPEDHKQWLSEILCSPFISAIEFELERIARLKIAIHKAVKEAKGDK